MARAVVWQFLSGETIKWSFSYSTSVDGNLPLSYHFAAILNDAAATLRSLHRKVTYYLQ